MTAPVPVPCHDHVIVRAGGSDTDVLATLIATAFHDLPVSQWLIAGPVARQAIYPAYFRGEVEHAMAAGLVHTTADRTAAALWFPADGPAAPSAGYAGWLAAVTGPHLGRFLSFDEERDRHHPVGVTHHHLAILAVHPGRQRLGIGTALLDAHHTRLDQQGIPAYLEAASTGSRDLYLRHGYELLPDSPIRLPAGPAMWPMWRAPHPAPGKPDGRPAPEIP
jgi:GNAT superfamily N-acetyltransferase